MFLLHTFLVQMFNKSSIYTTIVREYLLLARFMTAYSKEEDARMKTLFYYYYRSSTSIKSKQRMTLSKIAIFKKSLIIYNL